MFENTPPLQKEQAIAARVVVSVVADEELPSFLFEVMDGAARRAGYDGMMARGLLRESK